LVLISNGVADKTGFTREPSPSEGDLDAIAALKLSPVATPTPLFSFTTLFSFSYLIDLVLVFLAQRISVR